MNHKHCEDFQLACYNEDELFGLHRDDTDKQSMHRGATVLVYLSSPSKGGETLFTNKALENESDLDTGKPLTTQDGALKLFRHYCLKPKKEFTVVSPKVGRAVSWRTWNNDKFVKDSTHGACPPLKGKKCVIQQWLYRNKIHPLRNPNVAAIFPAGADSRYRSKDYYAVLSSTGQIRNCIFDVSTSKKQSVISNLCIHNKEADEKQILFQLNEYEYGPHTGISSLRIKSPLVSSLPLRFIQSSFTVSFHAANLPPNSILISLGTFVTVTFLGRTDEGLTFEIRANSSIKKISFFHWGSDTDWFWYSFTYHHISNLSSFSVCSDRKRLGFGTFINKITDIEEEVNLELLRIPSQECQSQGAFVSPKCDDDVFVDISFIIFHSTVIEDEKELLSLSRQAMRYDINT